MVVAMTSSVGSVASIGHLLGSRKGCSSLQKMDLDDFVKAVAYYGGESNRVTLIKECDLTLSP